jgi:hypothetical protein
VDVQEEAVTRTRKRLQEGGYVSNVYYTCGSHDTFPPIILPGTVSCVNYNLGYLPGSDKKVITEPESTVKSLINAQKLIKPGGVLTVMAYRGHAGGQEEEDAVLNLFNQPMFDRWQIDKYARQIRVKAPVLITARLIK